MVEEYAVGAKCLGFLFHGTTVAAFSTHKGASHLKIPENWVVGEFHSPDLGERIYEAFEGMTAFSTGQSPILLAMMIENLIAEIPTLQETMHFLKVLCHILTASVLLTIFPKLRTSQEWETYVRVVRESVSPILEPLRRFVVQESDPFVNLEFACGEQFSRMADLVRKLDGYEAADEEEAEEGEAEEETDDE